MIKANEYRTVTCGELREENIGQQVRVAGWVENIRDHGGVMFLDIRDQYGVLQVVVHNDELLKDINKECTVTLSGTVVKRDEETINKKIATGFVEVHTEDIKVLGKCKNVLPFEVATSTNTNEEVRLKYRFLDLRNPKVHNNIMIRSQIITFLRNKMNEMGFMEIQTPILSTSSPEGARDYLIPSRKHKGRFYALPQAPQIFKQLLMVSGFDRYFQIAPCFRDEDARADRSPGEFYQLDFEMAFATQEDVFAVAEEVLYETFKKFSNKEVSKPPFARIPYAESMLKYGTDKPDLRNPLVIVEISDMFEETDFAPFRKKTVRSINVPNAAGQSKKWFKKIQSLRVRSEQRLQSVLTLSIQAVLKCALSLTSRCLREMKKQIKLSSHTILSQCHRAVLTAFLTRIPKRFLLISTISFATVLSFHQALFVTTILKL